MDQAQYQQGMPAAPPSYDDSMAAGGAGGFAPPPPPGQMYPGLPGKEGAPPPPASYPAPQQPQAPVQVVTQVQYVAAPSFGYRPVTMTCPHCQVIFPERLVVETLISPINIQDSNFEESG